MISEEQFQANCVKWFDNNYPLERGMLFAVDNNLSHRLPSHVRAIEGNRKKAIGCRAGVSDLIFVTSDGVYFIELKLKGGVQSPEQKEFQRKIEARGWTYIIIRELSEFQDFINAML